MTTRISGLSGSGLDIDSLVKESMKPYQMKVDTQKQEKQKLQWQQEQYQKIMGDVTTFYNKYLDTTSNDSLYSFRNYNTTKFTSSNESAVAVNAVGTAANQDYQVNVTQLAGKASATLNDTKLAGIATANYNNATKATTTIGGQDITFDTVDVSNAKLDAAGLRTSFDNAIAAKKQELQDKIDAETDTTKKASLQKTLDAFKKTTDAYVASDKDSIIQNSDLNSTSEVALTKDGITNTFYVTTKVSKAINYSKTLESYNANNKTGVTAAYSDFSKGLTFSGGTAGTGDFTITNTSTNSSLIGASEGKSTKLHATITNGKSEQYIIDDNTPQTADIQNNKVTLDGVTFNFKGITYVTDANGNKLDSSGKITTDPGQYVGGSATISGSKDVTDIKNKIKAFVDDYNKLLGSINTKIFETYDKDYQPLTDEQRSAMSDSQITKWETKAQTGLLRKDDLLTNLSDSMKDAMSTFMYDSKVDLESLGISPKENEWTDKNGLLEVNDEKLTNALENNFDAVKNLFMKNATVSTNDTSNSGIAVKMRQIFKDNVTDWGSVFNKKAGGGVYMTTNELTLELKDKNKKITEMNKDLKERQNTFYSKYSKLESALAKAQSQQASMSSLFSSGN